MVLGGWVGRHFDISFHLFSGAGKTPRDIIIDIGIFFSFLLVRVPSRSLLGTLHPNRGFLPTGHVHTRTHEEVSLDLFSSQPNGGMFYVDRFSQYNFDSHQL